VCKFQEYLILCPQIKKNIKLNNKMRKWYEILLHYLLQNTDGAKPQHQHNIGFLYSNIEPTKYTQSNTQTDTKDHDGN
jgi:hypothetical protein